MTKRRVLFVDDDPNILSGIRRVLRSFRDDFELYFAENGKDALEIMAGTTFDVVVSDMRMPGMDGADLLKKVQELYPCTIRIMLTGQADQNSILRTVGVVHQFLEKPSNPDILKSVLIRSSTLYHLLANDKIKEIVSRIESLPSLPDIYVRLQQAVSKLDVSVAEVAAIIEKDMAMSAKVLQLVNSAFFGMFQPVESPARAVGLLGLDTIKGLVLGVQVFEGMKSSSKLFSLNRLMEHSMAVGACAKKIAQAETNDKAVIDHSFIGGILHDVGKLVLASRMQEQYDQTILLAREQNISPLDAEIQIFHTGHDSVGAYLIGIWGLPGPVVEAIGFHHFPGDLPEGAFSPALAVHAANALYYENKPHKGDNAPTCLDLEFLEKNGLANRIEVWREICAELLQQE
ncbi:MAG: HDOD domain-containing protein [Proteobacteria bacterium]|nr:HDOD domain-containing protein [Pseudomonadota bacterium]MBU1650000.1 HDOD domain-containing protein [Pseudomonadota bacterium]